MILERSQSLQNEVRGMVPTAGIDGKKRLRQSSIGIDLMDLNYSGSIAKKMNVETSEILFIN
jgi:hypothetical protein